MSAFVWILTSDGELNDQRIVQYSQIQTNTGDHIYHLDLVASGTLWQEGQNQESATAAGAAQNCENLKLRFQHVTQMSSPDALAPHIEQNTQITLKS